MKFILTVGAGSFIGGVSRYLLNLFIQSKTASIFPVGTLVVNILGCLLIGIVFGLSSKVNFELKLFLTTGLLGGFTTFSAFSVESVALIQNQQYWYASVYIVSSVILGLIATFIGISFARLF